VVLTEENVISSLDLRSGDICESSCPSIANQSACSRMLCANILRVFFNHLLNICGLNVVQFGDMSLTRTTPWISLVYHLENVSLPLEICSRGHLSVTAVCLFHSVGSFHS
jgi:hypothetical protein